MRHFVSITLDLNNNMASEDEIITFGTNSFFWLNILVEESSVRGKQRCVQIEQFGQGDRAHVLCDFCGLLVHPPLRSVEYTASWPAGTTTSYFRRAGQTPCNVIPLLRLAQIDSMLSLPTSPAVHRTVVFGKFGLVSPSRLYPYIVWSGSQTYGHYSMCWICKSIQLSW